MASTTAADHFDRLARLLDLEARAEREQHAARLAAGHPESDGATLAGLVVRGEEPALGGRLVLTLTRANPSEQLPHAGRLRTGAPVLLTEQPSNNPFVIRGVVVGRDRVALRVAVEPTDDGLPEDVAWRVDLS